MKVTQFIWERKYAVAMLVVEGAYTVTDLLSDYSQSARHFHVLTPKIILQVVQPQIDMLIRFADKCERWLNCEDPFLKGYIEKFSLLPTCPCTYPLLRTNHVYDDYHRKTFKWRDSEYSRSYLVAYQRGN